MGVDRSVTYYLELSCCSVLHPPGGCGLCYGSQLGAGNCGPRPAPAGLRERPKGGHAYLMAPAGRQPGPGSPACTPPCQDCSNRAILALELTCRQPMVRRGGCGRGLTAKKKANSRSAPDVALRGSRLTRWQPMASTSIALTPLLELYYTLPKDCTQHIGNGDNTSITNNR